MTQRTLFDYEQTEDENSDNTNMPEEEFDKSNSDGKQQCVSEDSSDPNDPGQHDDDDDHPGSLCPCYEEELRKCRKERGKEFLDEYYIRPIKCGHAISYLNENVGTTVSEGTGRTYASKLRRYIEFIQEMDMIICDAELKHVDQYLKSLAKNDYSEESISSHRTSIINLHKHISLYRDADPSVRWDLIREEHKPSDYQTPEPWNRNPLTKEELIKLYKSIDDTRNKVLVQLAVEVGARNTDLCLIKLDDIDFDEQKIRLQNTKAGGTYTLPITSELKLLLRRWIDTHRPTYPGAEDHEFLFPSNNGGKLNKSGVNKMVKKAAEEAGIQSTEGTMVMTERQKKALNTEKEYRERNKVTAHTLRHTFCYLLEEAGLPPEAISTALDHNSIKVTKEYYSSKESDYIDLIRELFTGLDI